MKVMSVVRFNLYSGTRVYKLIASLIFECEKNIGDKEDAKFKILLIFLNGKSKLMIFHKVTLYLRFLR